MKLHYHHFMRLMSDDIFLSLIVIRHAAQTIPFLLLVSLFFSSVFNHKGSSVLGD